LTSRSQIFEMSAGRGSNLAYEGTWRVSRHWFKNTAYIRRRATRRRV